MVQLSHLDIETIVNDGLFTYTHSPHEACSENEVFTQLNLFLLGVIQLSRLFNL